MTGQRSEQRSALGEARPDIPDTPDISDGQDILLIGCPSCPNVREDPCCSWSMECSWIWEWLFGWTPHLPEFIGKIWEPPCGSSKMAAALRQVGFDVVGSDITHGVDFLGQAPETGVSAIITNPPYALAREFIERALRFDDISHSRNALAHHAANRVHLFADCAMFAKKVVLTKRIRWFEDSN